MGVRHVSFDRERRRVPVSGSMIRGRPFRYWDLMPQNVRPYFVRKICLRGPESVGKSTLAERLASLFHTVHVPEMARDIIADSRNCRYEDLVRVAISQAREIRRMQMHANKILICDTGLLTTRVYAQLLFDRDLPVADWILEENTFALHLFLDIDVPHVQDGTRLDAHTQRAFREALLSALESFDTPFETVSGDFERRFQTAVRAIQDRVISSLS